MRFKKSIHPKDIKNEYAPNSYFTIKLPRGKLDLHSFTLYYDGNPANYANTNGTNVTGTGATVYQRTIRRFFPRLASCVIGELIIKINNQVKQHIKEYNMIHAILNDIHKEYDDLDSTAFDTIQEHKLENTITVPAVGGSPATIEPVIVNRLKIQAVAGHLPKYVDEYTESFFVSEWLGLLQQGNTRYLDTTNMDVEIQIKTAPANILYQGINSIDTVTQVVVTSFDPDYKLSNIYATIDILDEIPEQPSEIKFLDYHYTEGEIKDDTKRSLTSFQINKPVNWLLGTFGNRLRLVDAQLQLQHAHSFTAVFGGLLKNEITQANYNNKIPNGFLYSYDVAKAQKDPYLLNSSIFFDREGIGIEYCKYRVNNYDLTPNMNIVACFNETKKCFDSRYKKVLSLPSFESDFFCNAVRVDDSTEELKNIEWEVHDNSKYVKPTGGVPMLFCCFTNKL